MEREILAAYALGEGGKGGERRRETRKEEEWTGGEETERGREKGDREEWEEKKGGRGGGRRYGREGRRWNEGERRYRGMGGELKRIGEEGMIGGRCKEEMEETGG